MYFRSSLLAVSTHAIGVKGLASCERRTAGRPGSVWASGRIQYQVDHTWTEDWCNTRYLCFGIERTIRICLQNEYNVLGMKEESANWLQGSQELKSSVHVKVCQHECLLSCMTIYGVCTQQHRLYKHVCPSTSSLKMD